MVAGYRAGPAFSIKQFLRRHRKNDNLRAVGPRRNDPPDTPLRTLPPHRRPFMEQKYDGPAPHAELKLDGRKVTRTDVANDWGLQLLWVVKRDGKQVATAPARAEAAYEHAD